MASARSRRGDRCVAHSSAGLSRSSPRTSRGSEYSRRRRRQRRQRGDARLRTSRSADHRVDAQTWDRSAYRQPRSSADYLEASRLEIFAARGATSRQELPERVDRRPTMALARGCASGRLDARAQTARRATAGTHAARHVQRSSVLGPRRTAGRSRRQAVYGGCEAASSARGSRQRHRRSVGKWRTRAVSVRHEPSPRRSSRCGARSSVGHLDASSQSSESAS